MKLEVTLQQAKRINLSKHRNSKNQSLQFVDSSGKKVNGHPARHFMQVSNLQQERFNLKFEAFSLLTQDELKDLFKTLPKDKVKGNTDKAALVQAYYNSCFETFKALSKDILDSYSGTVLDNLDEVQKQALNDAKEILNQETVINKEIEN